MPLEREDALKRAKEILTTSSQGRAAYEAACGLWLAYTYGNQWAQIDENRGAGYALQQLKTIVSSNRTDVRFCMNLISPRVIKVNSKIKPRRLDYRVKPQSRASNDQISALVGDSLLGRHMESTESVSTVRQASLWRIVLGSVIIRRTISQAGMPIVLRGADGKPLESSNGTPKTIRSFSHDWSVNPPYEFVRDPAANNVHFRGEDCIGHEKPMPVWKIKRDFGLTDEDLDVKSTMGQLLEFQRFLYSSTGQALDYGWRNSKTKAAMFGEWWFRDDEADKGRRWPWYMITVRDAKAETTDAAEMRVLYFGKNPFHGLPLTHFWYDEQLLTPWGRGVPAMTQMVQDAVNMAYMAIFRRLIHHSGDKYLIEQDSLIDPVSNWTNKVTVPVVYRRGSTIPKRLESAMMDPTSTLIMNAAPQWLDWMLNMSPVQSGEAVKRGEAAKAYEFRRDAADTPINSVIDDDEIQYNELLTGTLFDLVRHKKVKEIHAMLSGEYAFNQIATLKAQDVHRSLAGVRVVKDTLRPRTPQEQREDSAIAIESEMLDPIAARRSMLVRGGIALDAKEGEAFKQQIREIGDILEGEVEVVDVFPGQDHEMHQYVIGLEMESARWYAYTEEQQDGIQDHWRLHEEAKAKLMQFAAGPQMAGADMLQAEPQPEALPPAGAGMGLLPPPGQPGMPAQAPAMPGMQGMEAGGLSPAMPIPAEPGPMVGGMPLPAAAQGVL